MFRPVRVALVHDWLTGMRGGEKALEVEGRVDRALERCFVMKARSVARSSARAKVVKAATPVKPAPTVVVAAPRRAARAS